MTEGFSLPEDPLSSLGLIAEVLGTKQLPGSLDLISRLLETLHHVVQFASPTQADIDFIQQLLMSAVENAADGITVRLFHLFLHMLYRPIMTPGNTQLDTQRNQT